MTRRAALRTWGERLYEQHARNIAGLIGAEVIPEITVHVERHGPGAAWTHAHHEPNKATAGYQTTAHFLQHLERKHPGTVKELARTLMNDTYTPDVFQQVTGNPLERCVSEYEAEATTP